MVKVNNVMTCAHRRMFTSLLKRVADYGIIPLHRGDPCPAVGPIIG